MKIVGHDNNSRFFRLIGRGSAICLMCNTEFSFNKGEMTDSLKSHICPEKPVDPVTAEIVDNFTKILLEHKATCEKNGVGA